MNLQISPGRIRLDWRLQLPIIVIAIWLLGGLPRAQDAGADSRQQRFDEILDTNVRDGLVYYRALKGDRARLDGYIASLANVQLDSASPQEQVAFWVNGYNAIVLRTVVDHYPIQARTRDYPANSIRQIPGAFERATHKLAGRTVTLDQIEQTVLPAFHDPRVFFALGRGAVGSGRLRSEAYSPAKLEQQLAEDAAECASRSQCVQIDPTQNVMRVSSIFSWRRDQFVEAYADKARTGFADRSPVERAVLAFIDPRMLNAEQDFLKKNTFKMEYLPFDWSLNDLTGRGGR
jgi:hypothetical protein